MQRELMELCTSSIYYWLNYFVWTYKTKFVDTDSHRELKTSIAHVPFVTWPAQDVAIAAIIKAIETGNDALISKSRNEGASWLCLAVYHWYWLFTPDAQLLEVSRIEDLVDKSDDTLTLFWKHDYINRHLPEWMLPCSRTELIKGGGRYRRHMQITNPRLGCTITGQASTEHIGRGGRYLSVFFDEMSSMPHAADAWRSAHDAAVSRIANSTPLGVGTEYSRLREQGRTTSTPIVVDLMYYNNPEKGIGRTIVTDLDGTVTGVVGRQFVETDWFRARRQTADRIDIGQNILADDVSSGHTFFNPESISKHMQTHSLDPVRCDLAPDGIFSPSPNGRWFLWAKWANLLPTFPPGDYVGFVDISRGYGASNSIIAVMHRETGEIIAEYADPHIEPHELADEAALAGRTVFKGPSGQMFMGWEVNGPGEEWYLEMQRLRYRRVYFRRRLGSKLNKKGKQFGWRSGRREKEIMLTRFNAAFQRGEVIIHSMAGLSEMLDYTVFPDGSLAPGWLIDEASGARASHGDRVIAYAGCIFMRAELTSPQAPSPLEYPPGSYGEALDHLRIVNPAKAAAIARREKLRYGNAERVLNATCDMQETHE